METSQNPNNRNGNGHQDPNYYQRESSLSADENRTDHEADRQGEGNASDGDYFHPDSQRTHDRAREAGSDNEARWDAQAGRYAESGEGIVDERQTHDRDQRYDAGSKTDNEVARLNPDRESLTDDEK